MIPEEVATIMDMLIQGYDIEPMVASRAAWDIYDEFNKRLLPEGITIDAG